MLSDDVCAFEALVVALVDPAARPRRPTGRPFKVDPALAQGVPPHGFPRPSRRGGPGGGGPGKGRGRGGRPDDDGPDDGFGGDGDEGAHGGAQGGAESPPDKPPGRPRGKAGGGGGRRRKGGGQPRGGRANKAPD